MVELSALTPKIKGLNPFTGTDLQWVLCWLELPLCHSGKVVEHLDLNPKVKGLNPFTGTGLR